jgi:ElaB/YqjD/DUF883 family membrane-anchored ribosome-binding protein
VAKDTVLSRELKALQAELSASHRQHRAPPAALESARTATAEQPEDTAGAAQLREELAEFVNEITEFVKDAENNVSAHPTASVLGAMSVGLLIGYLIGRR